jgi:hypothetical protein
LFTEHETFWSLENHFFTIVAFRATTLSLRRTFLHGNR